MTGITAPERKSFFTGPLDDWPNDDLLFDAEQRAFLLRHHPQAGPIFDWQELRDLFSEYDPPASHFRKRSRRNGVRAVLLGCLGLALTAIAAGGLFGDAEWPRRILGAAGGALALASGIVGIGGVLSGGLKDRWLKNRFWTERMRQLHFQLIIGNLPLAVEIVEGRTAFAEWEKLRARTLDGFVNRHMKPVETSLDRMRKDVADDEPWLDPRWAGLARGRRARRRGAGGAGRAVRGAEISALRYPAALFGAQAQAWLRLAAEPLERLAARGRHHDRAHAAARDGRRHSLPGRAGGGLAGLGAHDRRRAHRA